MQLTNKFNLPQPFVDAVSVDYYQRGSADFTASELPRPARIGALLLKHQDELVEDASERVWALSGQARHVILERAAAHDPERYQVEYRYEAKCPNLNGSDPLNISGRIDLYDFNEQTLYDFKETSVWKFILGDFKEWEQQANVNLYLMRMNGVDVRKLKNIAILKDWKARLARTTGRDDYPKCAVHVCDMPMWTVGEAQAYINKRAEAHSLARQRVEAGREPVLCTRSERWQREQTFAVMKKGRKRAIKLIQDQDQAEATLEWYEDHANPGEKFYLEDRPTEPVRCLDFCSVWKFCQFGREAHDKWNGSICSEAGNEEMEE